MKTIDTPYGYETCLIGALAGTAGGVAEILWIGLYGTVSGNDTTELARSISTVVGGVLPASSLFSAPVASGLSIHMFAAVALGIALAFAWRALSLRNLVYGDEYRVLPAALAIIWAFNFFLLLPIISPYFAELHRSFTEIVPYPVSLISKLLFGLAAATVLTVARKSRAQSVLIRI